MIVRAGTVVTLDGAASVHSPGYVAIDAGVITDMGSGNPTGSDVVDLGERLVMPGLINAHTHTPMSLFRGLAEGHSLLGMEGWYFTIRRPELHLDASMIPPAVELSCAEMIATGTTSLADQYFFTDQIVPVLQRAGLRGTLAYGIVELGSETQRAAELDKAGAFLQSLRNDPLLRAWVGPHAFFVDNTEAAIVAERELAERFGAGLHAHFSTRGEEDAFCLAEHGMTALQRLDQLGVLDQPLVMAHCLKVDDVDLHLLANRPVVMVMIASAAMVSGASPSPVRRLLDAGVTVAIGTDNVANNGSYDLFEEMRTLAKLTAFTEQRPNALSAREVLTLATAGGAAAIGMAGRAGALEVGMAADLIALDPRGLHRGPAGAQDIHSAIVFGGSGRTVSDAMVAGRWLYRDGEHLTVDPVSARAACDVAFAELSARMASAPEETLPPLVARALG